MNKTLTIIIATLGLLSLPAFSAEQRAKTADGREVILRDDGTWIYADEVARSPLLKDKSAVLQYKGKRNTFALYLPPNRWKPTDAINGDAEVSFQHKDGDAYALVIAERIAIPLPTLKKFALDKIQSLDPEAKIIKEEKRKVNGAEVLCLAINAKPDGIAVTYYSYYYSGEAGSIQIVTFTGQNLFEELRPELDKFLNGFTPLKKDGSK